MVELTLNRLPLCWRCRGNCEVNVSYPSGYRETRICWYCDGIGRRMSSAERKLLALPMRKVYDAAYDAWYAWVEGRPFTAKQTEAVRIASEFDPLKVPFYLRECAEHLKERVLAPSDRASIDKWRSDLIVCLINVGRVLVAFETPLARCKNCKTTARNGGGPTCECDK